MQPLSLGSERQGGPSRRPRRQGTQAASSGRGYGDRDRVASRGRGVAGATACQCPAAAAANVAPMPKATVSSTPGIIISTKICK